MTEASRGSTRIEVRTHLPAVAALDRAVWRAYLDGRRCRTQGRFLVEVGEVLSFPAYYGHNWDAFHECFGDLLETTEGGMGHEFYDRPGRPERTLHLIVRHAEDLLVDAAPRDLGVLVWKLEHPYPQYEPPQPWHRYATLRVTIVCAPDTARPFGERLDVARRFRHDGVA